MPCLLSMLHTILLMLHSLRPMFYSLLPMLHSFLPMQVHNSHLDFAKDKILMGMEHRSRVVPEHVRKLTAYHESGHALVALHTPGATPLYKVTIIPRGAAGGLTQLLPDDDTVMQSKKSLLAGLQVAMGGRAAEELIFGQEEVTSGAMGDIQQATKLAHQMVQVFPCCLLAYLVQGSSEMLHSEHGTGPAGHGSF